MDEPVQRAQKEGDHQQASTGDGAAQPHWGPQPTRAIVAAPASGVGSPLPAAPPPPASNVPPPPPAPTTSSQPPPPPPIGPPSARATKTKRHQPSLTLGVIAAALAGAFAFNLGLQSRVDSLAVLIAVSIVAAMVVAAPNGRRLAVVAPALMAIAAAAVTVLRASPWVTIPAIVTWVSCLIVAAGGQLFAGTGLAASFGGYVGSLSESVVITVRGITGLIGGTGSATATQNGGTSTNRAQLFRGLMAAAVVIIPMTWLLASADAAFSQLLSGLFQGNFFVHIGITLAVLPAIVAIAVETRRKPTPPSPAVAAMEAAASGGPKATMLEGTVVLVAVASLLGVWGATQVVVALGGAERLLETAGLTAAANARQGFFQLVAVTAMLVLVVIAVDRFVARTQQSDHRRFLVLSAIIGVETLGVIIASYSRLALYIDRFGNTVLRTWVAWFLAWLAVVMAILIVAINHKRLGLQSTAGPVFLLAGFWAVSFGLFNPEAFVARRNLERDNTDLALDVRYLTEDLGTDAIPTVIGHLRDLDGEEAIPLIEQLCDLEPAQSEYGPFGWNRSEAVAKQKLAIIDCGP